MKYTALAFAVAIAIALGGCDQQAASVAATPEAQWKVAYSAYVRCIDNDVGPRLQDFAKHGIPITDELIARIVDDAEDLCKPQATQAVFARRANGAPPGVTDEEIRGRLKTDEVTYYVLDQQDGNRCFGMKEQYCY